MKKEVCRREKIVIQSLFIPILLIISIFIISGCGLTTGPGAGETYYKGYDGLNLKFFSSNPKSVFEDDYFATYLFINNNGPYSVDESSPGSLQIGYDDYYIESLGENTKRITIHGKDSEYPAGDMDYAEFPFHAKNLSNLRDSIVTNIAYSICYPYRTDLTIATCIDTKIYSNDPRPEACKATIYTDNKGQGGPVAITKIEPVITSADSNHILPQYNIYFKNMDKGYVIKRNPDNKDICAVFSRSAISDNIDKLQVTAKLSKLNLECSPKEVRIYEDKESFVRCSIRKEDSGMFIKTRKNYPTVLTVSLHYGYVEVYNQPIEIKRQYEVVPQDNDCDYYSIKIDGKCISLCEYCSKNPNAKECQKNKNENFSFDNTFGCTCSKQKCLAMSGSGKCIFGYCPGSNYCCTINECTDKADGTECGDNKVCKGGACSQQTECDYKYGKDGFICSLSSVCDSATIRTELCPGGTDKICCKPAAVNDCSKYSDGAPCNDNHICVAGKCSEELNRCDWTKGSIGYSCMQSSECKEGTVITNLCPGNTANVCCVGK